MNRVFTVILGVLVVAAIATLVWLRPNLETTRDREQRGDLLFNFQLSQVTGLKIRTGTDVLELTKDGDSWRMGPKVKDRASAQTVYQILDLLKNLRVLDVIPAREFNNGLKSNEFGLGKPKQTVEIQIGKQREELRIGKDGAGEKQVFVRVGESEATYLVEDTFRSALAKPLESFRDPRLTDLQPEQIERIQILRGPSEIELRRDNSGWRLQRPLQTVADSPQVDKLLGRLLGARIIEFLNDSEPAAGADLDNDSPREIRFWAEGEDAPHVLRILGAGPEREGFSTLLVDDAHRDARIFVAEEPFGLAKVGANELRDRAPLRVNLDLVDRITVKRGTSTESFSRAADTGWVNEAGTDATLRVQELAAAVNGLQVASFSPVADPGTLPSGPDSIEIHFDAWLSENTPETTAGGQPVARIWAGKTADGKTLVRVNDASDIFELSPDGWERLAKSASQSPSTEASPTPPTAP